MKSQIGAKLRTTLSENSDSDLEFRLRLQDEFARRCRVNERYSVRAFANHLDLDSSTLSQILSGKRKVSAKMIGKVYTMLGLQVENKNNSAEPAFSMIDLDTFAVISDWYHFAILDLTLLKSFKNDPKWIARKLSISENEASLAIERLLRLGMVQEKRGKLTKSKAFYSNSLDGKTSVAHKEYQRQVVKKALLAIDGCSQDRKDITSMTIAANSARLNQAKEKIKKFRRELCAFLEEGEPDSVYHLALQLYPVTNFEN